ncbi:MAG: aminotransferase class I/II-fold pyridoxal phosphate-dependent enzyme [Anaerolineae bacterium]|nr:aminotransferase class I/II-fold pyridoxal phosphate-dependent enzyme [Anaerolineae bacterium]
MRHFTSRRMAKVPPSAIRRFFDILNTLDDVISLGIGEPDFVTPEHIRQASIESLHAGMTSYSSNAGAIELRELIAAKLDELYGVRYDPEDEVLVTVGASEAIADAMIAVLDPGDEVIIPQPCFVSYAPSVIFAGGKPVTVDTYYEHQFAVTATEIEAKITPRTKMIFLSYPSNPTGAVVSREEMCKIAQVAQERDLLVLSDEIYDRLVYGVEHVCVASLPGMQERTLHVGGFSKSYAMTGWRIGFIAGPREIISAVAKVHQYAIMCAPTMAQHAAIQALKHGEPDVQRMVAEYDRRRQVIVRGFNSIGLPTFEPRGAFYCFPKITAAGMSSEEFAERLLIEEKVAMVPGGAFGPTGKGHVRACYAAPMEEIEEALVRIGRFIEKHVS